MGALLKSVSLAAVQVRIINITLSTENTNYHSVQQHLHYLHHRLINMCMMMKQQCPTKVHHTITCDDNDGFRLKPNTISRFLRLAIADLQKPNAKVKIPPFYIKTRIGALVLANIEDFITRFNKSKALKTVHKWLGRREQKKSRKSLKEH